MNDILDRRVKLYHNISYLKTFKFDHALTREQQQKVSNEEKILKDKFTFYDRYIKNRRKYER